MKTFASKDKKYLSVHRNSGAAQPGHHFERTQQAGEVRRILGDPRLQPKLKVSDPNDAYEQEADRVADAVMRMPDEALSRQPLEGEEEELLQTKRTDIKESCPDLQPQVEEEETVQTKPLADQITPLVQRQTAQIPKSTAGASHKELAEESEEKWPIGWYRRYARDEQAVEIFKYWVEGQGGELVLENEKWKKYMMNNKLLERQIIKQLTADALNRKRMFEVSKIDVLSGNLGVLRFQAVIENGYRTGYELLHGTNAEEGDFTIEGSFIARKDLQIPNAIGVNYDIEFTWNDIQDPLKGHFTDEMAVIFFRTFSNYTPKDYTLRIKWKTNAMMKVAGGQVWGGILKEKGASEIPSYTFGQ